MSLTLHNTSLESIDLEDKSHFIFSKLPLNKKRKFAWHPGWADWYFFFFNICGLRGDLIIYKN
jgi:hypothetical protein